EVQRRGDDEDPTRSEDPRDLVERPPDLEDVLERLDAKHRAGRLIRQADRRHILDAVHARTWTHVAADVVSCREELAEVGVAFLPFDLVRAELEDRTRAVDRLGHQAAERLVVVAHRRGSSLSRAGKTSSRRAERSGRRSHRGASRLDPSDRWNRADPKSEPPNGQVED